MSYAKYQIFCPGLNVTNTCPDNIAIPTILVTKVTTINWYNTASTYGTDLSPPNIIWIYPQKTFAIVPVVQLDIIDNNKVWP